MKTDYSEHWPVVHSTKTMARIRFQETLRRIAKGDGHKRKRTSKH